METGGTKVRLTLFTKILAAFILIMAPICALGAMINVWGHNSVRREQMESSRMNILLFFNGLEYEFRYALGQQVKLVDNQDMMLFASAQGRYDDVAYYKAGIAVRKALSDLKESNSDLNESNSFITEAKAYLPARGMAISTETGISAIDGEYGEMKALAQRGAYPFTEYNGELISCIASDVSFGESDDNIYLIALKFSKEKLKNMLREQEDAGSGRRAALVSMNHGITLTDEPDGEVSRSISDFALSHRGDPADSGTGTVRAGSKTFFVTWARSGLLQTMLLFYTPEEHLTGMLADYQYWLVALAALTVAGVFLFSVWMRRLIISPLKKLADAYRSLEKGDFNVELKYGRNDEFGFLYERSNEMIRRLGALVEDVYEQRIRASEAELKQLQYQINPHFLYNSILIVGNLIKMTDYECAGKLAFHLGNYYQYLTKGADFVPLSRECEHARNYIEIQAIRFADRFSCRFDAPPPGAEGLVVPRLILQPLIENAFKYGLAATVRGGLLQVGMAREENALCIAVEDNGGSLAEAKIAELNAMAAGDAGMGDASGLMNVHRRLRIQFGRGAGLSFKRSGLGGLRVEMRVPWPEGGGGKDV